MKKLTSQGVVHHLLLGAVILAFAIAGVGYMVTSHADTQSPGLDAGSGEPVNSFSNGRVLKAAEDAKLSGSGCSAAGCSAYLSVDPHSAKAWTSSRTYLQSEVVTPYFYVRGKQALFGEVVTSCKLREYGRGIAAEFTGCGRPRTRLNVTVSNVTDKKLLVHMVLTVETPKK